MQWVYILVNRKSGLPIYCVNNLEQKLYACGAEP